MSKQKNISNYYQLPILEGLELLRASSFTQNFPFHQHQTFNISLILQNTFVTKLDNKTLRAPVGTISITNANEVHATPCDTISGNSFFTFYISPLVMRTLNNGQDLFFEDKVIYDRQLFTELVFLSNNLHQGNIDFEKKLLNALSKLINNFADLPRTTKSQQRLFQQFIQEESLEDFSLSKTAAQFGIDKFKFIRLFKQETGLTPQNFVLWKRIENSKELLRGGNPIFDVAILSGFYDASHFYKYFKRFTGVTPLEFQNAFNSK